MKWTDLQWKIKDECIDQIRNNYCEYVCSICSQNYILNADAHSNCWVIFFTEQVKSYMTCNEKDVQNEQISLCCITERFKRHL